MNWLVFHIVSGQAFFSGAFLIGVAAIVSVSNRPAIRRFTVSAFLLGSIAVLVSSTAISYLMVAAIAGATLAWGVSYGKATWRRRTAAAVVGVWVVATGLEIPYHINPALHPVSDRSLTVIGDSVTAGTGGDETSETWPTILSRQHSLKIQDVSHIGETAGSAFKRIQSLSVSSSVIIVEIGGNDILGSTTVTEFARDLDRLVSHLADKNRQLVMFELPLPPFFHSYGRVQREVAARYNVKLVPKRVFLSVIAGSSSTLDSIHLSQDGHQKMADCVWSLVKSAFADLGNTPRSSL
jgi:acyl-CoA thioesterase-1